MTALTLQQRMKASIAASYKAAQKLDTIGMKVTVRKDDGSTLVTTLVSLPWTLAHGTWVAKVEGFSGGYDCARIAPVEEGRAA